MMRKAASSVVGTTLFLSATTHEAGARVLFTPSHGRASPYYSTSRLRSSLNAKNRQLSSAHRSRGSLRHFSRRRGFNSTTKSRSEEEDEKSRGEDDMDSEDEDDVEVEEDHNGEEIEEMTEPPEVEEETRTPAPEMTTNSTGRTGGSSSNNGNGWSNGSAKRWNGGIEPITSTTAAPSTTTSQTCAPTYWEAYPGGVQCSSLVNEHMAAPIGSDLKRCYCDSSANVMPGAPTDDVHVSGGHPSQGNLAKLCEDNCVAMGDCAAFRVKIWQAPDYTVKATCYYHSIGFNDASCGLDHAESNLGVYLYYNIEDSAKANCATIMTSIIQKMVCADPCHLKYYAASSSSFYSFSCMFMIINIKKQMIAGPSSII
ncbi:unnamed protein product [Amoebophrya sp. A25]|nr:unnamed protein product [Amoebophrya sp. A25]|eukprot:GSA25T00022133001.1